MCTEAWKIEDDMNIFAFSLKQFVNAGETNTKKMCV